jgi:hypothetical protein
MASMALHMNLLAPKQAMTWDQSMNQKVLTFLIIGPTQKTSKNLEEIFLQQLVSSIFIRKTKISKYQQKKNHILIKQQ